MKDPDDIINDPIKATLFGKFYEKIVLRWFENVEEYKVFEGKPRVYWRDVRFPVKATNDFAEKMNKKLSELKQTRRWCTPDGFLEKDGRYYIWEAKNWPLWTENKDPLVQLTDVLSDLPQILSKNVMYKNAFYEVDGFLFSWWKEPENVKDLENIVSNILKPGIFKIYYTSDVLKDCIENKYEWYIEIIDKEKSRVETLFNDLLGI